MRLKISIEYKRFTIIFFLVLVGYLLNLPRDYSKAIETRTFRRLLTSYDVTSVTFLPYEIIRYRTLHFSENTIKGMDNVEEATVHSIIKVNNKSYSSYPILAGIMALPIYLVPVLLNKIPTLLWVEDLAKILVLGRISAAIFTAFSVSLFYLVLLEIDKLKKRNTTNWIYLFVFFYAFGTNVYSIASRSLWQHTSSLLFITLAILFLLRSLSDAKYIKWLGIVSALMYLARPLNLVFVLAISAYVFFKHRNKFANYLLYAFPFFVLQLMYNTYAWGTPLTSEYIVKQDTAFSTPILTGLFGNLFSPARSFLFISPPLVLGFLGIVRTFLKKSKSNLDIVLKVLAITFFIIFVLYSKWWCWYGADRFGYGLFTEWVPIIGLFTYMLGKPKKKLLLVTFCLLVTWSVYLQTNAVVYRKSRCNGTHNWSFYCFKPGFLQKQEY